MQVCDPNNEHAEARYEQEERADPSQAEWKPRPEDCFSVSLCPLARLPL